MLLVWIGVGIGEVGGSFLFYFFIVDYFLVEECVLVFGVYVIGVLVGILFGNLLGGWINEFFGWCNVFFVVGILGILFVIVMKMIVKEFLWGYFEGVVKEVE